MKRLAILVTAFASSNALANDSEEKWVLFEDTYFDTGYTAFGGKAVSVLGESGANAFVAGGWHVTEKLATGLEAELLASRPQVDVDGAETLTSYQLGAFVEYKAYSLEMADFFGALAVGWGEAGYRFAAPPTAALELEEPTFQNDSFTYMEPRLSGFFHLSHRLDVGASFGYRLTRGVSLEGVPADGFDGLTSAFAIRGNF